MPYIPDQSHLDRVAEALWQPGGGKASVMIGSGFSKNAILNLGDRSSIPNWSELAWVMHDKLHPDVSLMPEQRDEMTTDRSLALAEQFEVTYGRADLHRFLKEEINDEAIEPGNTHERLLKLPWRDVFTTNWDTLLERTVDLVTNPSYSIIRNQDDLAIATGSRVIKLHGSLPSHFPLIVTEEDYRKYPKQFSPLVNTVQQAMMETTMLLIGFSGRDPNFIQWSGWVRDQLGESAPKIYLAGSLNLNAHERRVFESRNIVVIDLASHPRHSDWKTSGDEQAYATQWILRSLELAEPYPRHNWPSSHWPSLNSAAAIPTPELLQPVKSLEKEIPQKEPSVEDEDVEVADVLSIWRHNRKLYPGWVAVPAVSEQEYLSGRTAEWEGKILEHIQEQTIQEKLDAIHEILWRNHVLLEDISTDVAIVAYEVLDLLISPDSTAERNQQKEVPYRDFLRLVFSELLVHERLKMNHEGFAKLLTQCEDLGQIDPELVHVTKHERCLWALYALDFDLVRDLLEAWEIDHGDPFWKIRKAALMIEVGMDDDVIDLIQSTLVDLRRLGSRSGELAYISRDAWASYLMDFLNDNFLQPYRGKTGAALATFARSNCNVWDEVNILRRRLDRVSTEQTPPVFDLGVERPTMTAYRGSAYPVWGKEPRLRVAIIRAVRLGDMMGLPPKAGLFSVTADLISKAALELFDSHPELAIRLMLRIAALNNAELIDQLLSRTRIARLPESIIESLMTSCKTVIEQTTPPFESIPKLGGTHRIARLGVAIEVLSRLSVRMKGPAAIKAFNYALKLYADPDIHDHVLIADQVWGLLNRGWDSLDRSERSEFVLHVLRSPISGFESFGLNDSERFPDPGEVLGRSDMAQPVRTNSNEENWQSTVSFLVRALTTKGEARARAATRLTYISNRNLLNQEEMAEVASALWQKRNGEITELPTGTNLFDWVFLSMPEPRQGAAHEAFRQKWIAPRETEPLSIEIVEDTLWQLGHAKHNESRGQFSLAFTEEEQSYIERLISKWCRMPIFPPSPMFDRSRGRMQRAALGCAELLKHVRLTQETSEELLTQRTRLEAEGIPGLKLIPALCYSLPEQKDQFISLMRKAMASDEKIFARDAVQALLFWLKSSAEGFWDTPHTDLIKETGVIIATRRRTTLTDALELVEWVFCKGTKELQSLFVEMVLEGLNFLWFELDYGREDLSADLDVPYVRWRCVCVAVAMNDAGIKESVVDQWIRASSIDPMPEVRFAKDEMPYRMNA